MARWRQPGASEILLVYVLFAVVGCIGGWLSHSSALRDSVWPVLVTAFLAWRVSRGGRVSRTILLLISGASYASAALAVARLWDPGIAADAFIRAVQVLLLLTPPVYGRIRRPVSVEVRAPGWVSLVRRPPAWLVLSGLLAGVLVTAAFLASMVYVAVPGCRPATSDLCTALVEGYPLRWLTANQNTPLIFKGALLKDCVQWALVSTSVLYLAWLTMASSGRYATESNSRQPDVVRAGLKRR
jgi:hypothetical protein